MEHSAVECDGLKITLRVLLHTYLWSLLAGLASVGKVGPVGGPRLGRSSRRPGGERRRGTPGRRHAGRVDSCCHGAHIFFPTLFAGSSGVAQQSRPASSLQLSIQAKRQQRAERRERSLGDFCTIWASAQGVGISPPVYLLPYAPKSVRFVIISCFCFGQHTRLLL